MSKSFIHTYILENGFITLDHYMQLCLQDNDSGYYRTGNPIGKNGDFITAPEISQIFGELIGVFISFHLEKLFPNGYQICELGAGRGTLAHDYLRVLEKNMPSEIFFLESNAIFKQQQLMKIPNAKHIDALNQLPQKPTLFLANEFFDALPIKAFKLFGSEKSEIIIRLDSQENLKFDYASATKNDTQRHRGYVEISPMTLDFCSDIAHFIKDYHSSFLMCDYGYLSPLDTMTFRGFMNHTVTDGLQSPSHEDLTADVDFISIMNFFSQQSTHIYTPLTQADFLKAMHIDTRLHRLLHTLNTHDRKQHLINGVQKLLNPREMGERFKFLFISHARGELYPFSPLLEHTRVY
jgi:NADH dehydrogenase [ubiquinone] 1 alpha subcomplex assembly factor 7